MKQEIELGDLVKDEITGLEGIVVGITDWLYLCRTLEVKPQGLDKEGRPKPAVGMDEGQVKVLKKGVFKPRFPRTAPLAEAAKPPAPTGITGGPQRRVHRPRA